MKYFKNIVLTVFVLMMVAVASIVVAGRFGVGGVRALVVQSGSMEPSIGKKSVVVTAPGADYATGDVVTFKQSGRESVLVTHRVEEVTGAGLVTKGDANEEADAEVVPRGDVVGKVIFSIPFVGLLISFIQTPVGFLAFVVVPAVVIVYGEVLSLKKQIHEYLARRKYTHRFKILN